MPLYNPSASGGSAEWGGIAGNIAALTATFKNASATDVRIGTTSTSTDGYAGHIDELRILKGKAAQTAAFTPPTSAYPRS